MLIPDTCDYYVENETEYLYRVGIIPSELYHSNGFYQHTIQSPDKIDSNRLSAILGAYTPSSFRSNVQNANAFCRTCVPCLRRAVFQCTHMYYCVITY